MMGIKELTELVAELMANQQRMEERLAELEARPHPGPSPEGEGEATDDDLIYLLRNKGYEAYKEALTVRNKLRARRWGLDKRQRRVVA